MELSEAKKIAREYTENITHVGEESFAITRLLDELDRLDNDLCKRACAFAIYKMIEKGSCAFGTSTEFVNDDGSFEKKYITIKWTDVLDWLGINDGE